MENEWKGKKVRKKREGSTGRRSWEGGRELISLCGEMNIEVELIRKATTNADAGWDSDDDPDHAIDYGSRWDDYTTWGGSTDSLGGSDDYDWEDYYRRTND